MILGGARVGKRQVERQMDIQRERGERERERERQTDTAQR